jgi:endonuclease/exonuclease/phosphatase family metal-dependent hydrolase
MDKLRVATFNVENLFSRPQVFMFDDTTAGSAIMATIAELQALLEEDHYNKSRIVSLVKDNRLLAFVDVRCDRVNAEGASPTFFRLSQGELVGVNAAIDGRGDWIGAIEFKRQGLPARSSVTLKRVIGEELKPDILCLCEVEDRHVLRQFNEEVLGGEFDFEITLEGNDGRGIDVAVLSKFPIGNVRSNTHVAQGGRPVFDRDCLEVEIELDEKTRVAFLCNHFKSKGGPTSESKTDPRRLAQARAVAKILSDRYKHQDGTWKYAIVAGDLNENPDRNGNNGENLEGFETSIDPLLGVEGLWGVHKARPNTTDPASTPIDKRWTYEFQGRQQQIDHMLLTESLSKQVVDWGTVRTGRFTDGSNGVLEPLDAASDHAALWIDLNLSALTG